MTVKTVRKIVKIDEGKCNGCGACLLSCAEGALELVNGKAKLLSDKYCDGLGACLGECPQGAISIEEREAEGFDEAAARANTLKTAGEGLACGCSSAAVTRLKRKTGSVAAGESSALESRLAHWPVQLALVPASAPFLEDADLVLAADCVPFALASFHRDFLGDSALLVACPKLDDFKSHQARLNEILRRCRIKSLTVVHMEVPCCSGLVHMARQAVNASGKKVPIREVTITTGGEIKAGRP